GAVPDRPRRGGPAREYGRLRRKPSDRLQRHRRRPPPEPARRDRAHPHERLRTHRPAPLAAPRPAAPGAGPMADSQNDLAVLLTGGGARTAYQAGVLQAIADWLPAHTHCPFGVVTGTSGGAINAALLGAAAHDFRHA